MLIMFTIVDRHEANPEMYFSGSLGSPRSGSPVSLADPHAKGIKIIIYN